MVTSLTRQPPGGLTQSVVRRIREQVATGMICPGQCVPSERDLGRLLKVSRVTVRRGLEQLVRDGLLRREPGRGYFLRSADSPDRAPGSAAGSALVFVHDHPESELAAGSYHARMWAGAREEAARTGRLTLISSMPAGAWDPARAGSLATSAAGVLCDHGDEAPVRALLAAGLPVVQIDYPRTSPAVDCVIQDDSGGIALAVEHLHARGHRRIGYLDTSAALRERGRAVNSERRLAGFLVASARLGLDGSLTAPADRDAGRAAEGVARLLDAGATALVLPHRELWPDARSALAGRGVAIPGDFGLVVWGDPNPGEEEAGFPTSVTWSKEQMGREGVRRLLLRLERPDVEPAAIVIPAQLVDRGTGGRGPGGESR